MRVKLSNLLKYYKPLKETGNTDISITNIATHSSRVKPSGLFFAIKGEKTDGHNFIQDAIKNGAVAVVSDREIQYQGVTLIFVEDSKSALSAYSAAFYNFPAKEMDIIGVTGTNGKTTITNLIYQILSKETIAGLIGTSGYFYGDKKGSFGLTTPLADDLHFILKEMRDFGVKKVVMEVSSHALILKRVENISFKSVIFTNLTQDHLDFHKTIENYYRSKLKLFGMIENHKRSAVIVNADDQYGKRIMQDIDFTPVTYGIAGNADYNARILDVNMNGTKIQLKTPEGEKKISLNLIGKFNVYNSLAAIAWEMEGGKSMETVCQDICEVVPVPGRLEIIKKENEKFVVIDYAHTPAALENILMTLRKLVTGRLICVFGCGGDRDREKRPLMGKVAGILSELVYLTSDNPRIEDPMNILLDIELGIRDTGTEYFVIPDREEAIKRAIIGADINDCVLLAGKGDEEYQIIGEKRIPFSDRLVAHKYL